MRIGLSWLKPLIVNPKSKIHPFSFPWVHARDVDPIHHPSMGEGNGPNPISCARAEVAQIVLLGDDESRECGLRDDACGSDLVKASGSVCRKLRMLSGRSVPCWPAVQIKRWRFGAWSFSVGDCSSSHPCHPIAQFIELPTVPIHGLQATGPGGSPNLR